MHRSVALCFCLAVSSILGCGGGVSPVPVEGIVTLDGTPLAGATVAFLPLTAAAAGPYTGETDATGKFTLGTAEDPGGGAVPAEYYVNVTTVKDTGGGIESAPPPTQKEVVPLAYRNSSTKFTVPPEGTTTANFDMTSR